MKKLFIFLFLLSSVSFVGADKKGEAVSPDNKTTPQSKPHSTCKCAACQHADSSSVGKK